MAQYPQLTNAPIVEAVVEVHLETPGGASLEGFTSWALQNYPQVVHQAPDSDEDVNAKVFTTADQELAVRVAPRGFSFHVLAHYHGWSVHREQAREAWDALVAHVPIVSAVRSGLRYVNRFEIKADRPVSDYIRILPSFPDEIAPSLHEFMLRFAVPLGGERHGIIQQALGPPKENGSGRAVLDIEVFTLEKFSLPSGSESLWAEIDTLHDLLSRCFFESLQTPLLEQFT